MKLFGGSGGHSGAGRGRKAARRAEPADSPRQAVRTAPKPSGKKGGKVKKQLTKKQKQKRIIISAVVVAVLAVCLAGAAWIFIRPPEIKNDPTIKDPENGDKVDITGLLNSGTRIDDVFTFFVGAVDEDQTRTDALMVATMDTKKKTVNIMNIPRDTMCNNGYVEASRKINAAYGTKKGGNPDQTKKEIERLMGFQPDKYIIVNFDGIAAIVEAIGGVDYEIPFRMEYDDPSQNLHIDLYAGNQHLNGKQVVEFLRWRHNNDFSVQYPTGDEGRVETQQKFLKHLAGEVLQLKNITKIKEIANAVFENVKTDFTAGELIWMGMQALQIKNENIQFHTLPGYGQMSTAGTSLALSFFFPYYNETLELVNKYFNPYAEPITTLDIVSGPESGSYGSGGGTSYDPSDDYVWGDSGTSSGDDGGSESDPPDSGGTGGEGTGSGTGGETGGGTGSDPSGTGGGDNAGGGETGGGENTGGGETGGENTGGGESGGGEGSGTGDAGGGDADGSIDPEA